MTQTAQPATAARAATAAPIPSGPDPSALSSSFALLLGGVVVASGWATAVGGWGGLAHPLRSWWWVPLGAAGWLIVAALGWVSGRLGVAAALGCVVAAQLVAGLVGDAIRGVSTIGAWDALGGLLVVLGAVVLAAGE